MGDDADNFSGGGEFHVFTGESAALIFVVEDDTIQTAENILQIEAQLGKCIETALKIGAEIGFSDDLALGKAE